MCNLCWETPVERTPVPRAATPRAPWRWLFPSTPLYPTLPRGSSWTCKLCLSKQAGGLIFKKWHLFCTSSPSLSDLSICCTYTTVESVGAGFISGTVTLPPPQPPHTHHLPHCLSLSSFFPLSVSRLTTEGCWNITDFIHQQKPTHPQTHSAFGYPLSSFHTLSH